MGVGVGDGVGDGVGEYVGAAVGAGVGARVVAGAGVGLDVTTVHVSWMRGAATLRLPPTTRLSDPTTVACHARRAPPVRRSALASSASDPTARQARVSPTRAATTQPCLRSLKYSQRAGLSPPVLREIYTGRAPCVICPAARA